MNYNCELPKDIIFGRGSRHRLLELLPEGNVLIICGKHSRAQVESELLPSLTRRRVELICDFPPEPPLPAVENVLKKGRKFSVAAVIGWGGGSAIDAAKAVASLLDETGTINDYFYNRLTAHPRKCFFAALPTTAGTGAEVTANSVLTDPITGIKQSLRTPNMVADVAIVDPELLQGTPKHVLAGCGFDALAQAIESFVSLRANGFTRYQALTAARLLLGSLSKAYNGDNHVLDDLAKGSLWAGMALSVSGLGAVHGIGHPLGSICHVPHGICCGILLPAIMSWNLAAPCNRLTELATALNFPTAEAFISHIQQLRKNLNIPENFHSYGLTPKFYPFIVANCRSGSMKSNPRPLCDDDVIKILEQLS